MLYPLKNSVAIWRIAGQVNRPMGTFIGAATSVTHLGVNTESFGVATERFAGSLTLHF